GATTSHRGGLPLPTTLPGSGRPSLSRRGMRQLGLASKTWGVRSEAFSAAVAAAGKTAAAAKVATTPVRAQALNSFRTETVMGVAPHIGWSTRDEPIRPTVNGRVLGGRSFTVGCDDSSLAHGNPANSQRSGAVPGSGRQRSPKQR